MRTTSFFFADIIVSSRPHCINRDFDGDENTAFHKQDVLFVVCKK